MDAQVEIELDEEDLEDENEGAAGIRNGRRTGRNDARTGNSNRATPHLGQGPGTVQTDKRLEVMSRNGDGSVHICENCNRKFRRLSSLNEHKEICEETDQARLQQ